MAIGGLQGSTMLHYAPPCSTMLQLRRIHEKGDTSSNSFKSPKQNPPNSSATSPKSSWFPPFSIYLSSLCVISSRFLKCDGSWGCEIMLNVCENKMRTASICINITHSQDRKADTGWYRHANESRATMQANDPTNSPHYSRTLEGIERVIHHGQLQHHSLPHTTEDDTISCNVARTHIETYWNFGSELSLYVISRCSVWFFGKSLANMSNPFQKGMTSKILLPTLATMIS